MSRLPTPGAPYQAEFMQLATTTATAVLTAEKGQTIRVRQIRISNGNAAARSATVEVHKSAIPAQFHLWSGKTVASNDAITIDLDGIPLETGDQIRVTASAANDLHVLVIYTDYGDGGS